MPELTEDILARLRKAIQPERVLDTTLRLCAAPSPTGQAGPALDCLAEMLQADGFSVERVAGGHAAAPAVICRLTTSRPGRTIQFNGHLDTVHLPFAAPRRLPDRITGSGSCDMKGGVAAAIEALRALRETGVLAAGGVLLTAHDLHEAPWGFGQQLNALITEGCVGDAVLIPEYLNHCLPVVGRGSATWRATIRRPGPPVHEVLRPANEPSVIDAGAELAARLRQMAAHLAHNIEARAGSESVFIGQMHAGEIFNQFPQECWLEGTRRWLPGTPPDSVEHEFRGLVEQVAKRTKTKIHVAFQLIRDAFLLPESSPIVAAFQQAYAQVAGAPLPLGPKPFVDDGNSFCALASVAAITHGPTGGGAHTVDEWVSIADLSRVALVYALTAAAFCPPPAE